MEATQHTHYMHCSLAYGTSQWPNGGLPASRTGYRANTLSVTVIVATFIHCFLWQWKRKNIYIRSREVMLPLSSSLVVPCLVFCAQIWALQYKRDMDILEWDQQRSTKMVMNVKHLTDEVRAVTAQPGEQKTWGDLINIYKYLMGLVKQMEPSNKTRGSGHKLNHRTSRLNIRKHFFMVRVAEHWHKLIRQVAESPGLEIFKTWLDTVLGDLDWAAEPAWAWGLDQMMSRGPFS